VWPCTSAIPVYPGRRAASTMLALAVFGCTAATNSRVTLPLQMPPDLGARVISVHHQQGWAPDGFYMDQYAVWVAIAPSDSANAGVLVGARQPVFLQAGDALVRDSAADITSGDSVQVWHDIGVDQGSAQDPPGAPGYTATQIVIVR